MLRYCLLILAGAVGAAEVPTLEASLRSLVDQDRAARTQVAELATRTATNQTSEWFGSDPGWTEWSRASGDWSGARTGLERRGFSFSGNYVWDSSFPMAGDVSRAAIVRGLLDLSLEFNPETWLGWPGGRFFVQSIGFHGRNGAEVVGDLQGCSNIDAEHFTKLEEFWYEQTMAGEQLRLKVGQVDANGEFACVDAAGDFLCPTAGYSPSIFTLPTYPHARLSVNLFVQPCEWFYAGAGAYGPELGDGFAGNHPFWIGEVGLQRAATAHVGAGRLALGVWQETAPVDRLDGGSRNGSTGFFSVGEQCVWREHPDSEADQQGAVIFYQYGWADRQVSAVAQHVAVGARWQGVVPGRDEDAVGIRYSWVQTSRVAGSGFSADETNWESFYRCQATRFIALTPNLQWIHHPGGKAGRPDTLIFSLRAAIVF